MQKLFWWFSPVLKIYVLHLERQLLLPASCALELLVGLRDLLYSSVSPVTPIFTDTPPWMHVGLSIKIADCVAKNTQKTTVLSHHCCQDTHTYFLLSAEREKMRHTCGVNMGSSHLPGYIFISLSLSPYVYMCVCMCVCVCKWPQTQLQKTLIKKNR